MLHKSFERKTWSWKRFSTWDGYFSRISTGWCERIYSEKWWGLCFMWRLEGLSWCAKCKMFLLQIKKNQRGILESLLWWQKPEGYDSVIGTAGVAILSCKDAKKDYTHCTAAVLLYLPEWRAQPIYWRNHKNILLVLQIIAKLTRGETILPKCNITVRKCEGHGKDLVPSVIKQTKNKLKQTY